MPKIVTKLLCAYGIASLVCVVGDYFYKMGAKDTAARPIEYAESHPDETFKEFLAEEKEV